MDLLQAPGVPGLTGSALTETSVQFFAVLGTCMAEQPSKQQHHLWATQCGGKPKFVMGYRRSLILTQPGRYFIAVAGLVPHVIWDPAELSSGEVRDVLPHVFLFIFLPSHIVSLLALLCSLWSSLILSVPPRVPFPTWSGREGRRQPFSRNRFDTCLFTLKKWECWRENILFVFPKKREK